MPRLDRAIRDERTARPSRRSLGVALGLFVGMAAWTASPTQSLAATPSDCAPAHGVKFICGVTNVEDWAPVPGTQWVIGGDLAAAGKQGTLYLFDTKNDTATPVESSDIAVKPDKQRYKDCPGAPDWKIFGPHGLDLTRGTGQHRTLYAVNHGGREAVEVFDVDLSKGKPAFTWVGCAVAPKGFWPDAVASLPNNEIVVTSLWDPEDPHRMDKLSKGEPVGALDTWSAEKGWVEVPGSAGMSGPNGVIASADGKELFIAVWSGKEVARISYGGKPEKKTVHTGFLTDNLRWGPDDHVIYVGGQATSVKQVIECFESQDVNCPKVPFQIDSMDPKTMKLTTLVKAGVLGEMGAGTGAIKVGNELWVSTFRGDRIARVPLK
jgi:hypothetical protein